LQRRERVDAALAELGSSVRPRKAVGGLFYQRAQLGRVHVAELSDDESGKAGNMGVAMEVPTAKA